MSRGRNPGRRRAVARNSPARQRGVCYTTGTPPRDSSGHLDMTASSLRDLHRIHEQLRDLRERSARGPKQVKAHEANVTRLEAEVGEGKNQVKAARVLADQKQLALKAGETKIEELRRKLNACSSNREYQALLEQIAADEMANSVLADEILETLEKVDALKAHATEAETRLAKGREELAKVQQAVQAQQATLETELVRVEGELHRAEAKLPSDLRDAYQRVVKSKGSDAMSQVEGQSCGGCNSTITPNMLNALKLDRVVFCQSCGRLLYLPEDRTVG
jgi:predicted  nucleic acid-binding Zn-ribbon protein